MFYLLSLEDFSQYGYPDKTGFCLLALFYEEIFKCTSGSKMHPLNFSKKSIMNNVCWLKALKVSDFYRYIGG